MTKIPKLVEPRQPWHPLELRGGGGNVPSRVAVCALNDDSESGLTEIAEEGGHHCRGDGEGLVRHFESEDPRYHGDIRQAQLKQPSVDVAGHKRCRWVAPRERDIQMPSTERDIVFRRATCWGSSN